MQLRYYQQDAINATWDYVRTRQGNPCCVIPTAGGKTPVMATMARDVVRWGGKCLVLAHVKELLRQSIDKLQAVAPDIEVGAWSAGLGRKDRDHPVIVAGVQSCYKNAFDFGRRDIVFVDEAHLIPPDGEGRYRTFLEDLKIANPHVRIIGFTATPYRMNSGLIVGPDNLLNEICYEVGVRELIVKGFISPLKSRKGLAVDTSGLHVSGGEYKAVESADLMDSCVDDALDQLVPLTAGRKSILVFATGLEHARKIAEGIAKRTGEDAQVVDGNTPSKQRDELVERFKGGGMYPLRWLVNVGVFTTGFDAPNVDCVALLRPTLSPGLYYQMVGRGFRLSPDTGKADCLVLDFANNVETHGPVDELRADGRRKGSGGGEAPVKECPDCGNYVGISYSVCLDCGYQFPAPEAKPAHGAFASDAAVTTLEIEDEEFEVGSVTYSEHIKRNAPKDSPHTLRVDYTFPGDMGKSVSEWICVEHGPGFARNKAIQWWSARSKQPMPSSAREAMKIGNAGGLAEPSVITVRESPGNKFPRITSYQLGPVPEAPDTFTADAERILSRYADREYISTEDLVRDFPSDAPDTDAAESILNAIAGEFGGFWDYIEAEGSFVDEKVFFLPGVPAIADDDLPF